MHRRRFLSLLGALAFWRPKPVTTLSTAITEDGKATVIPAFPSPEDWETPHLIITEYMTRAEFERRYCIIRIGGSLPWEK